MDSVRTRRPGRPAIVEQMVSEAEGTIRGLPALLA